MTAFSVFHLNPHRISTTRDEDGILKRGGMEYLLKLHKVVQKVVLAGDQETSPEMVR